MEWSDLAKRGRATTLALRTVEEPASASMEPAFKIVTDGNVEEVIVPAGPMFFNERARIGSLALRHRVPTFVAVAEMVRYGAMLSYGPDFQDYFRQAAAYVDKILKGADPADLPIEQPTRFKLVLTENVARTIYFVA